MSRGPREGDQGDGSLGFQKCQGYGRLCIGVAYILIKVAANGPMDLFAYNNLSEELSNNQLFNSAANMLQNVIIILSVVLFWKVFDKKPLRDMGITPVKEGYRDFLKGLAFGIIAISTVFIILLVTGNVSVAKGLAHPEFTFDMLTGLLMFILVGFGEEIFSRGYCMTVLNQTGNRWVVVLVSSMIFSILHAVNPNVSALGLINIFLVGVLFAYMVLKTGSIWMPIGFHITWNYLQGNIFGFEVSGQEIQGGLYSTRYITENIVNGGKFGPEGGIATTIILLIFFVIIWKLIKTKSNYMLSDKKETEELEAAAQ